MEVKLAWKVLSPAESGRYLHRTAKVRETCKAGAKLVDKTLGLVGFHISQKTSGYGQWIWSTFEHVDNLAPADGAVSASFYNPKCENCISNTSQVGSDGVCRTQVTRTEAIPPDVKAINDQFRDFLTREKSVLQYYHLIGVQYVPFGQTYDPKPGNDNSKHENDAWNPTPPVLRNSVMETYLVKQAGDTHSSGSCTGAPVDKNSSCVNCHKKGLDFSFIPSVWFCNCSDKKWQIGDEKCSKLQYDMKRCLK